MLDLIASALNRNDETPNIELTKKLADTQYAGGISEIVAGLRMDRATANDCIKVLYEIGERNPRLLLPHADVFLRLQKSKNNRLVWGTMTVLAQITEIYPEKVFEKFDDIYAAFETGSVITVDQSISVFAGLCRAGHLYEQKILPILIHHFANCRAKEIPQHFERAAVCITTDNAALFKAAVQKRHGEMTAAQQARVRKVLKRLEG